MKCSEACVLIQLIFHALSCSDEVPHILGVYDPKLRCGREENVTDVLDERPLLALTNVKLLKNAATRLTEIEYIAKDAFDE